MITFLSRTGLMNEGFFISRINLSLEPLESPSIIPFVLVEIKEYLTSSCDIPGNNAKMESSPLMDNPNPASINFILRVASTISGSNLKSNDLLYGITLVVLNVLVAASHEANMPSIMSPTGCLSATSNMSPSFPILNIPSDSLKPNMKFCSVPRSTSIPAKPAVTPAPVSPSLIRIMLSRTSTLSA